jgi:hypothetical protein
MLESLNFWVVNKSLGTIVPESIIRVIILYAIGTVFESRILSGVFIADILS